MNLLDPNAIESGLLGGIRTLWLNREHANFRAVLLVRAGYADEALPFRGWTHLVEHLASGPPLPPGPLEVNAGVFPERTSFDYRGQADHVWTALERTLTWLGDPQFDELDHEIAALTGEEANRAANSPLTRAFSFRYGLAGLGNAMTPEFILLNVDHEQLRELTNSFFTADNSVLILNGRPPRGLPTLLPSGQYRPLVEPAVFVPTTPGWYPSADSHLVLTGLVPRTGAASLLPQLLRWRTQRILYGERLPYASQATAQAVSPTRTLLGVIADLPFRPSEGFADRWLEQVILREWSSADQALLDGLSTSRRARFCDPDLAFDALVQCAGTWLDQDEPQSPADVLSCWADANFADAEQAIRELQQTLLVAVPDAMPAPSGLSLNTPPTITRAEGTRYPVVGSPDYAMVASETSIQISQPRRTLAMNFADVVWVEDFADGGLILHDSAAWVMQLTPSYHDDFEQLRAQVIARIPSTAVWVTSEEYLS